jgi:hypothetical protein
LLVIGVNRGDDVPRCVDEGGQLNMHRVGHYSIDGGDRKPVSAMNATVAVYCTALVYWRIPMKRMALLVLGVSLVSSAAFAQAPAADLETALIPAPSNLKEVATVIKW